MSLGDPPQPVEDASWEGVEFLILEPFERENFKVCYFMLTKFVFLLRIFFLIIAV